MSSGSHRGKEMKVKIYLKMLLEFSVCLLIFSLCSYTEVYKLLQGPAHCAM